MARLSTQDLRRVSSVTSSLRTLVDGAPSALDLHLGEIAELFDADRAIAVGYAPAAEDAIAVDFLYVHALPATVLRRHLDAWVRHQPPVSWACFNPLRPEPAQQNVALTAGGLLRMTGRNPTALPVAAALAGPLGLAGLDLLRVLLCEEGALLAWVGLFRAARFSDRDRQLLSQIIPALRRRLEIEALLDLGVESRAALAAALEAVPAPAFFIDRAGRVRTANTAGRALYDGSPRQVTDLMAGLAAGRPMVEGAEVVRVSAAGVPERLLVVLHNRTLQIPSRVGAAAKKWRLTQRQIQVLALMAEGLSNKAIGIRLAMALPTVKAHVAAVLAKAGCESRASLLAALWRFEA